jgi:hypothetical protein
MNLPADPGIGARMARDIDELTDALRRAYPEITVEQTRTTVGGAGEAADEGVWHVRHPAALADVHVESATGDAPFLVESDLAPPTVARTVGQAVRLVTERMGLDIGA